MFATVVNTKKIFLSVILASKLKRVANEPANDTANNPNATVATTGQIPGNY